MAQTGFTPILLYSTSTAAAAPAVANLTNSTLGSELAINITDGKLFYKDNANAIQVIGWKIVPATAGGTGQTVYAVGDILYASTTTALSKLADVATGNALISGGVGVAPSYGKIGLTTHVSGVLPIANGGTNASTASITSFNNITGYSASGATGTTTTNLVFSTSPTLTTPAISGDASITGGAFSFIPGTSDATTYNQAVLKGGTASGNGIGYMKRQTTASVANSATDILGVGSFGTFVIVTGVGGGAIFSDLLMASYNGVAVISSNTQQGGPAARTYSTASGYLRLTMGSATAMAIIAQSIETGGTGA